LYKVNVNGTQVSVDAPGDTPLLWVLRDFVRLSGTKYGCGIGMCGACTVHLDERPTKSCVLPLAAVEGRMVRTIEVLSEDPVGASLQKAWVALQVIQCGYCQSGQLMAAAALLKRTPKPTDEQIDFAMSGNICRCGTYPRIRAAIRHAAGTE
jgi:isoquinoline 1-oxidoreductase subunit alpha